MRAVDQQVQTQTEYKSGSGKMVQYAQMEFSPTVHINPNNVLSPLVASSDSLMTPTLGKPMISKFYEMKDGGKGIKTEQRKNIDPDKSDYLD